MKDIPTVRRGPVELPGIGVPVQPASRRVRTRPQTVTIRLLLALGIGILLVAGWNLLARSMDPSILPGPVIVWRRFLTALSSGTYVPALLTTAEEAACGWSIAALVALPIGYLIGLFRSLEDAVAPYLASSQAMPVVAIAPLLVVWLGFGSLPKVVICALIAFFPMLATTAAGIRGVPTDLRDAARVFGAGTLALARYVDFPLAARTIFAGMKVAAALAVTGAVVGEFVSSDQGLGFMVTFGEQNYDTPLMFVALLSLMGMGALAYALVGVVERIILKWDD